MNSIEPDLLFLRETLYDLKTEKLAQTINSCPSEYWVALLQKLTSSSRRSIVLQVYLVLATGGIFACALLLPLGPTRSSIGILVVPVTIIGWFWISTLRQRNRQEASLIACSINSDKHVIDTIRWLSAEGTDHRSKYGGMIVSGLYRNPPLFNLILTYIIENLDKVPVEAIRKYGPGLKPVLDRSLDDSLYKVSYTIAQKLQGKGVDSSKWESALPKQTT